MSYSQILSQDAYPADALYRPIAQPCTPSQASIAPRKAAVPEQAVAQQQSSSQVVVPSMSALVPLASAPYMGYYPQAYCQVPPSYMTHHHHHHHHQQHQQQQRMLPAASYHLVNMHPPIHHTLENATITYDTVTEHGVQKDLVKDVFFSPAMIQETEERSSSCGSSQSDSESEAGTDSSSSFSPLVTPSDLLQQDDPLFFIGLEFNNSDEVSSTDNASCSSCSSATSGSNTKPAALEYLKRTTADLPTPPGSVDMEYVQLGDSLKRRLLESASASKKQKRTLTTPKSTPPASPMLPFDLHYFEDASAEESSSSDDDSDDDQNTLSFDLAGNPVVAGSEDDNDSTTSWEEHHFFEEEDDSEEEDDDDDDDDSASEHEEEQVLPPLPPVRQVATRKHRQQTQTAVAPATVKQEEQQEQRQQQQQQATGVPPTPAEPVHDEFEGVEKVPPRPTAYPTIYQKLTKANVDWCRYCGTTEGVNWRPGPWGKRTLCNKHGCDYKGYGFACKLPRLDLTGFAHESIHDRERPVLQLFCAVCQRQESWQGNVLVRCEGCPKAVHQKCCPELLTDDIVASSEQWFCDAACRENTRRKRIVVELPRKRLPLMCAPKNNTSAASSSAHCSEGATRTTRSSSSSSFSR